MKRACFFITGLVRSRTAWFSAFMTASGYPCLHEGINGCKTNSEYKDKVEGISDSNTGLPIIINPYPERPLLIIHRDEIVDRVKSLSATFNGVNKKLSRMKGMHVYFDKIDNKIEEIFTFLTGHRIDRNIYNIFKSLNITTMENIDIISAKSIINETNKQVNN